MFKDLTGENKTTKILIFFYTYFIRFKTMRNEKPINNYIGNSKLFHKSN